MPNTSDLQVERILNSDERLLWSGQPRQGLRLRPADLFAIPFSLLWAGFACFWLYGVFAEKAPLLFKFVGTLFALCGLYLVVGRFFVDSQTRARTFYAVTSDRIIITSGLFSKRTQSLSLQDLFGVNLSERGDGSGTIAFGPQNPLAQRMPPGFPGYGRYASPAFEMIEHARDTYDIIRQAEKAARSNAA